MGVISCSDCIDICENMHKGGMEIWVVLPQPVGGG